MRNDVLARPDNRVADGNAIATTTYALAADSLAAVAVTGEPAGGVDAPSGDIVLLSTAR